MKHTTEEYKGYRIEQRVDVKSHVCLIYKGGDLVKCVAGDILKDGSENSKEKAKKFIDELI